MKKEGAPMVRTGRVVAQENGQIEVCFDRPEACAHCGGCGQKQRTLLRFPGEAAVGSRVDVEMPEGRLRGCCWGCGWAACFSPGKRLRPSAPCC